MCVCVCVCVRARARARVCVCARACVCVCPCPVWDLHENFSTDGVVSSSIPNENMVGRVLQKVYTVVCVCVCVFVLCIEVVYLEL